MGDSPDEVGIKSMLASLKGAAPRDEIDAMIAAQIAATHVAAMRYANRLADAASLQEQDSAERAYNKLVRTFATLVELYQRRRASSEKVAVQHASVSSGGNVTRPSHQPVFVRFPKSSDGGHWRTAACTNTA